MATRRDSSIQQRQQTLGDPHLDVFRYLDYRVFLKDWLAARRAGQSGFSLRDLAQCCSLSPSYLSMMLSGSRNLSANALTRMVQQLGFSDEEREYFRDLVVFGDSTSPAEKQDAYRRIHQAQWVRRIDAAENRTYEYFSHWYYVAIREMSALHGFKADPEWIFEKLHRKVSLREIRQALDFLSSHGLIQLSADGLRTEPSEQMECAGSVYKLALSRFHQEMLGLASESVETCSSAERNILGYTLAVTEEKFQRIKGLLDDLQRKVAEIAREPGRNDRVVQVELALYPLSRRE